MALFSGVTQYQAGYLLYCMAPPFLHFQRSFCFVGCYYTLLYIYVNIKNTDTYIFSCGKAVAGVKGIKKGGHHKHPPNF